MVIEASTVDDHFDRVRFVGHIQNIADTIIEIVEEHGYNYVFLSGRRRSPAGETIFGDTAQAVIPNFDGYVVTTAR